jgi:hypothetical protein
MSRIMLSGIASLIASSIASSPPPAAMAPAAANPQLSRVAFVHNLDASYKTLDLNGDGVLTASELNAFAVQQRKKQDEQQAKQQDMLFAKLDLNKDGYVSQAEFRAGTTKPKSPPIDGSAALKRLDKNSDQRISSGEYKAAPIAGFDRLDSDHDGILTADERRKAIQSK